MAGGNKMSDDLIESTWEEFRAAGLFWFVNRMLHLVGWTLVLELSTAPGDDPEKIVAVWPARTKYFGFSEEQDEENHKKLKKHLRGYIEEDYSG